MLDQNGFYRKMEKLLNVPAGSVEGGRELKTLESWDSLAILEFIVLADTDYQSNVEPSDITGCKTIDDLAKLTFENSPLNHESLHTGN